MLTRICLGGLNLLYSLKEVILALMRVVKNRVLVKKILYDVQEGKMYFQG